MNPIPEKNTVPLHVRNDFPSLQRKHRGKPVIYFDGPAGTQVPLAVIHAISEYYGKYNANSHGCFDTSRETDDMVLETRKLLATFLGSSSWKTISLGANMTTLNYSLSRAIRRSLEEGDEIVITQLDHEANRGPWLELEKTGIRVKEVRIHQNGTLDMDDLARKITRSTRLVAVGMASNALGTVNDLHLIRNLTHQAGAWLLADAVHYAPHFPIHVEELDVDFLLCSAYKFYGPHAGILYTREGLLDQLEPDRLKTQDQQAPYRIETGTPNFATIAGVGEAIRYLAGLGTGASLRDRLVSAMEKIGSYEKELALKLYHYLRSRPGVKIYGPPFEKYERTPTLSFTVEGKTAREVACFLGDLGIYVWDGDFYARRPVEVLNLSGRGGLVRIGMSIYNTGEEVERLTKAMNELFKTI